MPNIEAIQAALREQGIDGWLFYDILHRDPIAYRVLGLDHALAKRRWFYMIPAKGNPRKLVHRIEAATLDSLPGEKLLYAAAGELEKNLPKLIGRAKKVAMQYSPKNSIPYVSLVDAGTVELIRGQGCKVVSSAELVQQFEAAWTPEQLETHRAAGRSIDSITQAAFAEAARRVSAGENLTEYDLQQWIVAQFDAHGVVSDSPPIVAVGAHSGNPHYEPMAQGSAIIRRGDFLLLDIWAKTQTPNSVYYDITWVGYLGSKIPGKYAKIFSIVREARDSAVHFVQKNIAAGRNIAGWQVDGVAREVIRKAGYAKYFVHRTGHNIGQEVHGAGANMDGLETRDIRRIIPHTCFSVEPGIYLSEFGVRSEVDVYVGQNTAEVTGPAQMEIVKLFS
ncbi:MAG TPA: M24 family metallopeptidase [Candidatus Acidoferrales bacterium]|jgi:Xaa-Pro aminopeptidase|nr:M24 family metallopeptidase [Candidatus Acidoferrales bacterium]